MQGVFGAIKEISNCLSISSGLYKVFRCYYVSAVFRTIVDDSSLVFDSTTQILQGVLFKGCVMHESRASAHTVASALTRRTPVAR